MDGSAEGAGGEQELAYAVVEPGVSFYDLYDERGKHGYRLWAAVPGLGWGIVTKAASG